MNKKVSDKVEEPHFPGEIELYGDPGIATYDAKVPKFLMVVYVILPILGIIGMMIYWNGSRGWLDRSYWNELQIAANTTFPLENHDMPPNQQRQWNKQDPAYHLPNEEK